MDDDEPIEIPAEKVHRKLSKNKKKRSATDLGDDASSTAVATTFDGSKKVRLHVPLIDSSSEDSRKFIFIFTFLSIPTCWGIDDHKPWTESIDMSNGFTSLPLSSPDRNHCSWKIPVISLADCIALVQRSQRESDSAAEFLESLSGSFVDLDLSYMSVQNLNSLLNFHRNEYLGNLAKVQVHHARAMQSSKMGKKLADLIASQEKGPACEATNGVGSLSISWKVFPAISSKTLSFLHKRLSLIFLCYLLW